LKEVMEVEKVLSGPSSEKRMKEIWSTLPGVHPPRFTCLVMGRVAENIPKQVLEMKRACEEDY
jgi:hypothetical protein